MDKVMKGVLGGLQDVNVQMANGEKPCGLNYSDDVSLLESTEHAQHALGGLTRVVLSLVSTCFALYLQYKMLLQGWTTRKLMLDGHQLPIVDRFT